MVQKLSDLFEAAMQPVIEWQGRLVYSIYELPPMNRGNELRVQLSSSASAHSQVLRVTARGGDLDLDGDVLNNISLWTANAPPVVVMRALPRRGKAVTVQLWNAWQDSLGALQAWIGNSGMLIEGDPEVATGLVLRCSDGYNEATFDDLIVKVNLVRAA